MPPTQKIKWQKVVSREYSFLYSDYTNDVYKIMKKLVGTTLGHNLFYGEKNILNIYRADNDVKKSYQMIEKIAAWPQAIIEKMDAYDELIKKNYQLFKQIKTLNDKQEIKEKLEELDKTFLLTAAYFLFFLFFSVTPLIIPILKNSLKNMARALRRSECIRLIWI